MNCIYDFYQCIDACRFNYSKELTSVANASLIAAAVIGALAASGALTGSAITWGIVGLGASSFLFNLAGKHLLDRKVELLMDFCAAASLITLGTLGAYSILNISSIAIGVLVSIGALFIYHRLNRYFFEELYMDERNRCSGNFSDASSNSDLGDYTEELFREKND